MSARAYRLINGADPQLRRAAVEIRFSRSGNFYSRFGAMLDVLSESRPDWFFNPDTKNGLAGSFVCVSSGLDASIGDTRITASLSQKPDLAPYSAEDISQFASECDYLADVYCSNVKPSERTRIGFRQFYEADFETEELANQWVMSLNIVAPNDSIATTLESEITNLSFAMTLRAKQYGIRLAIESGQKNALIDRGDNVATVRPHMLSEKQKEVLLQAEKRSAWIKRSRSSSVTIDLDSYVEQPDDDVLVGEFIKKANRETYNKLVEVVEAGKQ
ncbi:hypothetical protein [Novipirellula caenicola]